jgi:hypothetical protein
LFAEIRNHIYTYLVQEGSIGLLHKELELPNETSSWVEYCAYPALSQVCRSLRLEYLPFFLSKTCVWVELEDLNTYALHFDRYLKHCLIDLRVCCCDNGSETCWEALPLLTLAVEAPKLKISFHSTHECLNQLLNSDAGDLTKLIDLSRNNIALQAYVTKAITSIVLHCPQGRCYHEIDCMMVPSLSTRQRDARLHVKFAKEHKQVWMDGTHSFGELQTLLSETGLDGLTAVKVQIGQASMENKSRGKGLRTEEEQQAVDWLLRRSKKQPKDVKVVPKMLRELE